MYNLLLLVLIAAGAWLIRQGLVQNRRARMIGGIALIILTLGFFGFMSLWGEFLWFEALGYARRFWLFLGAQVGTALSGALLGALLTSALLWPLRKSPVIRFAVWFAATGGAVWGATSWSELLVFLNRVTTELQEPVFGQDSGFYMFALPFYDALYGLAVFVTLLSTAASAIALTLQAEQQGTGIAQQRGGAPFVALAVSAAMLIVVLGAGHVLDAFHLLFSDWGVVTGAGWTDVHVRLPLYLAMAAIMVLLAGLLLWPRVRQAIGTRLVPVTTLKSPALNAMLAVGGTIAALWLLVVSLVPMLIQWLVVEPNEITFERPYIQRNIDFTLHGFHLNKVEERQFPAGETFTREMVEENRNLLSEIRLWDWRALDAVYKQFQEIRLYYEFVDVDIDRYTLGDRYRQVMVSARELAQENLATQSQTFVNRRFKYTHGYGLTMATVSDFTEEGLPNLLVKDIPPKVTHPELRVERPQIYYGELTDGPAVVNSDEEEFDYPKGEKNKYIHYPGEGGVVLSNLWRKFLFGWKFDGTRLLLSGYPNPRSRIMFHRQVRERVNQVAPFLTFDEDPYVVLAEGRLYWIIDAYTTSDYFPYSEPFSSRERIEYRNSQSSRNVYRQTVRDLQGVNYVRNSVKAVVDAFDGDVNFYVFEPQDPLIQVWRRILPEVFHDRDRMPQALRRHVRYPQDFLLAQGLVYAKYHMQDPEVFYNQEDLWVRATEKHYNQVQPVDPYYVMWELPETDDTEFVLIQPFTPKNRQVLIGWIAGMSDGDNYGRFLAYQFPKEKRVLGPQQVETKIDQDSFLSGQLTLWDQRGSNVIRGNVLAIPIDDTLIYVEPIYLQAETAAYPELRLVVVMHGDTMSYASSFDKALEGLFEKQPAALPQTAPALNMQQMGKRLNEAFESYLQALSEKQFDEAAAHLNTLSELIERMSQQQGTTPATPRSQ